MGFNFIKLDLNRFQSRALILCNQEFKNSELRLVPLCTAVTTDNHLGRVQWPARGEILSEIRREDLSNLQKIIGKFPSNLKFSFPPRLVLRCQRSFLGALQTEWFSMIKIKIKLISN